MPVERATHSKSNVFHLCVCRYFNWIVYPLHIFITSSWTSPKWRGTPHLYYWWLFGGDGSVTLSPATSLNYSSLQMGHCSTNNNMLLLHSTQGWDYAAAGVWVLRVVRPSPGARPNAHKLARLDWVTSRVLCLWSKRKRRWQVCICRLYFTLHWRHNERDGVSNHRYIDCLQPFGQSQIKANTKAPRHWPLWEEFTDDPWIPLTNDQ